MSVRLQRLDEALVADLLGLAVTAAAPEEVMPPVEGPPGWNEVRRSFFVDFYRSRLGGLDGENRTVMFAIMLDGQVIGMIRMARTRVPGEYETGIWLGRDHRGRGLGNAALRALLDEVRAIGGRAVVATTSPGNAAALGVLRAIGAVLTRDESMGTVLARVAVGPPPEAVRRTNRAN